MDNLALDLRAAARALVQRPALTAVAVLTLALGVGANTALFSVVHAVLLRPLPFREAERLVMVTSRAVNSDFELTSGGDYLDWRDQSRLLSAIAAWHGTQGYTLQQGERPERLHGSAVSANFLTVLGVHPAQGRNFLPVEEKIEGGRSILVSQRLWDRLFGSGTRLAGQSLKLDDQVYSIVGVLPRDFLFPRNPEADVLKPLVLDETVERSRTQMTLLQVVARLAPGASPGPLRAELEAIQKRAVDASLEERAAAGPGASPPPPPGAPGGDGRLIVRVGPGPGGPGGRPGGPPRAPETLLLVQPLREWLVGDVRPTLLLLLGSVGCVLLIACANVANLLLARATARRQEIAVRAALGAGRGRILRLLLTESVLLALLGGAAGLLLARWTIGPLVALMPADLADGMFRQTRIGIDGPILLFTFLVAGATGVLFGLAPALSASRVNLQDPLKEGGRTSTRPGSLRGLLVAAEVAVAAVLLVLAGLLLHSFLRLQAVHPGFDADRLLSLRLDLDPKRYDSPERQIALFQDIARRTGSLPGVESATFASSMPLTGFGLIRRGIQVEGGLEMPPEEQPEVAIILTGPGYFQTLGIPLLKGRSFTDADRDGALPVAIVSRSMARRLWGEADPLGKRIVGIEDMTVVGVAEDVKYEGVATSSQRVVLYQPFAQRPIPFGLLAVRTPGDPAALLAAVQREIQAIDPALLVQDPATLRDRLRRSVADRRFQLSLFGGFALLALGLAAVGLYGVLSQAVGERTHEIGIRMALGAARGSVQALILRHGLLLSALGAGLGLLLSVPVGRLVRSSLFGVGPADPVTYLLIPAMLLAVALLSSWLPARRATRVDPVISLRSER